MASKMSKPTLLDKIYPQKQYNVNGKIIKKPRNKMIFIAVLVIIIFIGMLFFIPIRNITIKFEQFPVIIEKMFSPNTGKTKSWAGWFLYIKETVLPLMLETINMCFLGTLFGATLAIPFSILAARNISKKGIIYQPVKLFMNFIRTIPTYVLAVIAMICFGIGLLTGVVAMTIFTFGLLTKMLYEVIETVDMGPFESLESAGAHKIEAFRYAVIPQILPIFIGYFIYAFEINVRGSVILGYVGAGGIGLELDTAISEGAHYYDRVGAIVVVIFLVVLILQGFTRYARGKLQ